MSASSSGTRALTTLSEDTDTCRAEAPGADTDNDGIADELQPLYRARNGDTLRGEDPYKLYIERNLIAAEAILGQSDYDPDDDGWSLVAVSGQILTAEYNRILLADSTNFVLSPDGAFTSAMLASLDQAARRQVTPIALYRELLLQCKAVKPTNLTTVKLNDTAPRGTTAASGFEGQCN